MECPPGLKKTLVDRGWWDDFVRIQETKRDLYRRNNYAKPGERAAKETLDHFVRKLIAEGSAVPVAQPPSIEPEREEVDPAQEQAIREAVQLQECRPDVDQTGPVDMEAAVVWVAEALGLMDAGTHPGKAPNGTAYSLLGMAVADRTAFFAMWQRVARQSLDQVAGRDDDGREIFKLIDEFEADERRRRELPAVCVLKEPETTAAGVG